jgi:hypothetical protein
MTRAISAIAAFWGSLSLMDRLYLLTAPFIVYAVLFHIFGMVFGAPEGSTGGDLYGWYDVYPEQSCPEPTVQTPTWI